MGNSRHVIVASNLAATEAHLLRGRLEAEGIRSWVDDEHTASVYPMHGVALGGVKVKVHVDDEAFARELMYGKQADLSATPTCPDCGAVEAVERRWPFWRFWR